MVILELLSGQAHSKRVAGIFAAACICVPVATFATVSISSNELRGLSVLLAALMVSTVIGSNSVRSKVAKQAEGTRT